MPITIVPKDVNEPPRPEEASAPESPSVTGEAQPQVLRGSRWVDYDTHELMEMISELEDERRWARLREGILWAVLFHILLISALTWIPKYVFKLPTVLDPINEIQKRKDLTYLDELPDALREVKPKMVIKPVAPRQTAVDKQTLESLRKPAPVAPVPPPQQPPPTPPQQAVQPPAPIPLPVQPTQQAQSTVETPRPAAVPARPNFAMNSDNPADQLKEAMRNSARNQGAGGVSNDQGGAGGLARHPGAGSGGVEILSDQQGVDFRNWIQRWHRETENTWDPLIPDEVNPPILKSGMVVIRFRVLPNGRLMEPNGVILEGRSGDTALDRAAWGALTGSNYPPLPKDFHGPFLELRAYFMYNMKPQK